MKVAVKTKLTLRKKIRFFIKIYLLTLLFISFSVTIFISTTNQTKLTVLAGSMSTSMMAACIFYVRKIYKNEINFNFIEPDQHEEISQKESGAILYYLFRPVIAIALGFILFIAINAQFKFIISGNSIDYQNFSNFMIVLSAISGYSTGTFLDKFEKLSLTHASSLVSKMKGFIRHGGNQNG